MNRLKAANSVPFANRDVAPLTGTAQFATDGNPATATPATIWPSYAWNMVQEEIMAVVNAAGLTPDDTNWAQLLQAIQTLTPALGQCRLSYVSASQIRLDPYQGNFLTINGVPRRIPQAGVTLSNAGLTAATLYYVYAYMSGATLTLEAVTTTHATDTSATNYGVEIKSGDATRTLVGMVYMGAGTPGTFVNPGGPTVLNQLILNWFNRRTLVLAGASVSSSTTSGSLVGVGTASTFNFLSWAGEAMFITCSGSLANLTAGDAANTAVIIDGGAAGTSPNGSSATAGVFFPATACAALSLGEGFHTAQPGLSTGGSGGTASCNLALEAIIRG